MGKEIILAIASYMRNLALIPNSLDNNKDEHDYTNKFLKQQEDLLSSLCAFGHRYQSIYQGLSFLYTQD